MAINLNTEYPDNSAPASSSYPFGAGRNVTLPGDNTGTPFDYKWFNDYTAFFQSLLVEAGTTPNDTVDTVGNSQYFNAFLGINAPAAVKKPVNVSPASGATVAATSPTLVASEYQSLYGRDHKNSRFRIATDAAMTNVIYDSGLLGPVEQHQTVTPITANATYYWDCRYTDEDDAVSAFSDATVFDIPTALVQTPTNQTPANGDLTVGEQVTVTSSAFSSVPISVHDASQWQITTDPTFTVIDFDSGTDLVNLLSFTQTGLSIGEVQYYWRVRHRSDTLGWSAYSTPTTFTTVAESVVTPTNVSPTNGQTGIGSSVLLQGSAFTTVPVVGQTHVASQWQVATDAAFTNIVFDSGEDTGNLESITATGLLANTTTHYWRVRYKGSATGYTDYSTPTTFVTVQQFSNWAAWDGTADGIILQTATDGLIYDHRNRLAADIGGGRFLVLTNVSGDPQIKIVTTLGLALASSGATVVPSGGFAISSQGIIRLADNKALIYYTASGPIRCNVLTVSGNVVTVGAQQTLFNPTAGTHAFDMAPVNSTTAFLAIRDASFQTVTMVVSISGDTVTVGTTQTTPVGYFGEHSGIDVRGTKAIVPKANSSTASTSFRVSVMDISGTTNSEAATLLVTTSGSTSQHLAFWLTDTLFLVMYLNTDNYTLETAVFTYNGSSAITLETKSSFEIQQTNGVPISISVAVVASNEIMFSYTAVDYKIYVRHAFIYSGNMFYGVKHAISVGTIAPANPTDLKIIDSNRILATWDEGGTYNLILNGEVI